MIKFTARSLARNVVGTAAVAAVAVPGLAIGHAEAAAGYTGRVTGQQGINARQAPSTHTAQGQMTGTVNKRSGPSTADTRIGSYAKGTKVRFRCQVTDPRSTATTAGTSPVTARPGCRPAT